MSNTVRTLMCLAVLAALGSPAVAETPTIEVPMVVKGPTIDGEVDAIWSHAKPAKPGHEVYGYRANVNDCDAQFQLLCDETNLYALFIVTDVERQNDSLDPWDDDAVELYLDGGHERQSYFYDTNDCQYVFGVGDSEVWTTEYTGDHAGVEFKSVDTDNGYRMEIQIPWKDLAVSAAPGVKFGIDVHVDDDDDGYDMDLALGWSTPYGDSWTDPSLFGTAIIGELVKEAVETPQPAAEEAPAVENRPGANPAEHDFAEMLARWEEACTPDKEHADLARFIGDWTTEHVMWMGAPGSEPTKTSGTATFSWLIPGRWLKQELSATIMGEPYTGFGISGYDNFKKKHVGSWIDSVSTTMSTFEGNATGDPDVSVGFGTMDEPMTGEHDRMVKYVTRWVSDDEHVFEIQDTGIAEKSTVVMRITYKRKK